MKEEVQLRFDYGALDTETRAFILERTERIHRLARATAAAIVQIGQDLTEVKARLKHGQFLDWIEKEFAWSRFTVDRLMNVGERVKCSNLQHLEIDISALYLIAKPSTPESVRQEAIRISMSGEHVTHSTVKAVIAQYNKTGNADVAVGELFKAVAEARKEAAAVLPSPAEARRTAIATGAHTLDRNGIYQPPMTVEQQEDYKTDMLRTDPAFQFCRWVNNGTISPEVATRIIIRRQWQQYYRGIDRAIQWLNELQEQLQHEAQSRRPTG